ncbi:MAG TPA: hypothetical protein VKR52_11000 [Terracidiphilus sp.]|nr:hypothetical protein [Terracidiphilus sp.]
MNKPNPDAHVGDEENRSSGPNLVLLFSLIAIALLIAIGIAALIVLPFYTRR